MSAPIPHPAKAALLARVGAIPSRTRAEGRRRAAALHAIAVACAITLFVAAGGVAHGAGRPPLLTAVIACGAGVLAAIAVHLAFGRGGSQVGRPRALLLLASVGLPAATFAWLTAFHGRYAPPFARFGWRCMGLTLAIAASFLAAALLVRTRTVVAAPVAAGMAIAVACGGVASVLVDLWCPLTDPPHVLVGHVAPLLLLAVVGAALGPPVLAMRRV